MDETKKINVKLLRRVRALILEEPRRLDMGTWAGRATGKKSERPPCGTVACIAGWTAILDEVDRTGKMPKGAALEDLNYLASERATALLGLDDEQADRLFDNPRETDPDDEGNFFDGDENLWPADLAEAYINAETPMQRARIAAKRIERFIKTNGAE